MSINRLINNLFFYTLIALSFIFLGSNTYRYMWNKTFEKIESETEI